MMKTTFLLSGILALSSICMSAQNSPAPTTKIVKDNSHQSDIAIPKTTLIIGPKKTKCMSINQQGDCFQVKRKESQKKWEAFSQPIKGFNYKPGFEYVIEVRLDRPKESLEGVTEEYTYLKTISKKIAK